jgi:hypothetical protein
MALNNQNYAYTNLDINLNKINQWIEINVNGLVNDLVNELLAENKITHNSIDNFFEKPNREDYDNEADYIEAQYEPQQVYEWHLVTDSAYNFFKKHGDPVVQYKGLNIWGRTATGQRIIVDFKYDKNRMEDLINNFHFF